jgi:hypothetical protein
MVQWIQSNETVLWWLAASSIITFIATLIVVPVLVARIPHDYFLIARHERPPLACQNPMARWMLKIGRNVLGLVFVVAGILMLALPGQGILTILIGVMLLNFPGKYRLERWIVSRESVFQSINWLRKRAGRPPIVLDG